MFKNSAITVLIAAALVIAIYLLATQQNERQPDARKDVAPAAQVLLDELNAWPEIELYLYNNPDIAWERQYIVGGESNSFIEEKLEKLELLKYPADWNNESKQYVFRDHIR